MLGFPGGSWLVEISARASVVVEMSVTQRSALRWTKGQIKREGKGDKRKQNNEGFFTDCSQNPSLDVEVTRHAGISSSRCWSSTA